MVVGLDDDIDRLFALPLDEFTAARDALAKELRAAGDKEGTSRVKALKKPNLPAWSLNQLARRHPDEIDELFDVTERVRRAQRKVMSGGKASELREVTDERNRVVARLTRLTRAILEEAGRAAAPQTMTAVGDSLLAIASDEEGAQVLRSGRLSRELKPEAIVDVGGLTLVPPEPEAPEPAKPGRDVAAARAAVEQATRRRDEAERAAESGEGETQRLAQAAEFARRAADARRAEADEAARALEGAEAALREAERD